MGKRLDALLGKSFKTYKFKKFVDLIISRIALLKVQHHARWSQARSDVVQLLTLGHQESTLLHVDHVIREQNMLDVLMIIEGYCHLLIERVILVKNSKACPDELKEAISSLIFAASRYGQLPELQKIRGVFTSKFGKQFAKRAVELRNDCGVNPKIVNKLPLQRSSLRTRLKVLKEIASENGITLRIQEIEEKANIKESTKLNDLEPKDNAQNLQEETKCNEKLSSFMKTRKKYKDVASAAQDAFELAARAAAAARAAVELSRLRLDESDPDDQYDFSRRQKNIFENQCNNHRQMNIFDVGEISGSKFQIDKHSASNKIHAIDISPISKSEEMEDKFRSHDIIGSGQGYMKEAVKVSSASSSDLTGDCEGDGTVSSYVAGQNHPLGHEVRFNRNHYEKGKKQDRLWWLEHCDFGGKSNFLINESRNEDDSDDNVDVLYYRSPQRQAQPAPVASSVEGRTTLGSTYSQASNRGRKPISVRTKQTNRP
ncbi:hypothetical protein F0562_005271 [Nyssa sinensis]|uniref:IST1-like protein n=1 Tax=Nyssa sinensis TaxID=561372 RepID=A0A5J5AL73_9ASTE|nr:hypothetical protein F0562_005271 [Nyssa sinensis]